MKYFILTLVLLILPIGFLFAGDGNEDLSDYDKKIVSMFKKYGHHDEIPMYPKDHPYWGELIWFKKQGEKVRPALMHLLRYDYANDIKKKSSVISALVNAKGDQSDILEYARNEIKLIDEKKTEEGMTGFIQTLLSVLSSHGDTKDLDEINRFSSHDNVLIRSSALTAKRNVTNRNKTKIDDQHAITPDRLQHENNKRAIHESKNLTKSKQRHKDRSVIWLYASTAAIACLALIILFRKKKLLEARE